MKKLIAMLLALVMLLALCACGQTAAPAAQSTACLLYTSPSPRAGLLARMTSSA